jgi:hypothetical protein
MTSSPGCFPSSLGESVETLGSRGDEIPALLPAGFAGQLGEIPAGRDKRRVGNRSRQRRGFGAISGRAETAQEQEKSKERYIWELIQ